MFVLGFSRVVVLSIGPSKNWVTTCVHSARSDTTQLSRWNAENVQNLATDKQLTVWVELSRIVRVFIATRALWTLSRSNSTQLNSSGQLSWVELCRIWRYGRGLTVRILCDQRP